MIKINLIFITSETLLKGIEEVFFNLKFFLETTGKHLQCDLVVMQTAESEFFVMPKVEEVTIARISALKLNQSLTRRVDGDRGSIEESAYRMYTLRLNPIAQCD